MKDLCKIMGEIAISGLPDISKAIGTNLLNVLSETSALTASLRQSTAWRLQPDVLKPITDALEWANKLPFQHAFDEIKRVIESPQYMAVTKNMTTFMRDFDWQWLADLQTKYVGVQTSPVEGSISQITEEDRKQVYEDVIEILQQPKQVQAGFEQKYEKWKERHPFLSDFFAQVFFPFLFVLLSLLLSQPATTITNSNIYEAPVSNSSIVYNTTINQTINIIGEAPYYYNVILVDPQTGTEYQGYIYKANVSVDSLTADDGTALYEFVPPESEDMESALTEDDVASE
ncbi:MAG: hypothetical protein IKU70_06625 [Clostridia bacterium]|nr:hypothetical protein [Clostridia bacterium]